MWMNVKEIMEIVVKSASTNQGLVNVLVDLVSFFLKMRKIATILTSVKNKNLVTRLMGYALILKGAISALVNLDIN